MFKTSQAEQHQQTWSGVAVVAASMHERKPRSTKEIMSYITIIDQCKKKQSREHIKCIFPEIILSKNQKQKGDTRDQKGQVSWRVLLLWEQQAGHSSEDVGKKYVMPADRRRLRKKSVSVFSLNPQKGIDQKNNCKIKMAPLLSTPC